MASDTLTAAQLEQLLKGNAVQQAAGKNYLLTHLGDEPKGVKVSGPGGIAGTLDTAATGVGNAASAVASSITSVSGLIGLITNGSLWKGIGLVVGGVLILLFAGKEVLSLTGV